MIYKSLQYQQMNIMKEPDEVATMFHFTFTIFRFGKPLKTWKGINFISFTIEIKFDIRKTYKKKWTYIPKNVVLQRKHSGIKFTDILVRLSIN